MGAVGLKGGTRILGVADGAKLFGSSDDGTKVSDLGSGVQGGARFFVGKKMWGEDGRVRTWRKMV